MHILYTQEKQEESENFLMNEAKLLERILILRRKDKLQTIWKEEIIQAEQTFIDGGLFSV